MAMAAGQEKGAMRNIFWTPTCLQAVKDAIEGAEESGSWILNIIFILYRELVSTKDEINGLMELL